MEENHSLALNIPSHTTKLIPAKNECIQQGKNDQLKNENFLDKVKQLKEQNLLLLRSFRSILPKTETNPSTSAHSISTNTNKNKVNKSVTGHVNFVPVLVPQVVNPLYDKSRKPREFSNDMVIDKKVPERDLCYPFSSALPLENEVFKSTKNLPPQKLHNNHKNLKRTKKASIQIKSKTISPEDIARRVHQNLDASQIHNSNNSASDQKCLPKTAKVSLAKLPSRVEKSLVVKNILKVDSSKARAERIGEKCGQKTKQRRRVRSNDISKPDSMWLSGSFDGIATSEYVEREFCSKCNVFDSGLEDWIFCVCCGDSFHLSCGESVPSSKHPISSYRPSIHYKVWYWKCSVCQRQCSKCNKKNVKTLLCSLCKNSVCFECDPSATPDIGYYYVCAFGCKESNERRCVGCDTYSSEIFCKACEGKPLCPICNFQYGEDDYSLKMVGCSKCDSWTHADCLGLSEEMYLALDTSDEDFLCRNCQRKDPEFDCGLGLSCFFCKTKTGIIAPITTSYDLACRKSTYFAHSACLKSAKRFNYIDRGQSGLREFVWLRKGPWSVYYGPTKEEDFRTFYLKIRCWNPHSDGQRTTLNVRICFDLQGNIESMKYTFSPIINIFETSQYIDCAIDPSKRTSLEDLESVFPRSSLFDDMQAKSFFRIQIILELRKLMMLHQHKNKLDPHSPMIENINSSVMEKKRRGRPKRIKTNPVSEDPLVVEDLDGSARLRRYERPLIKKHLLGVGDVQLSSQRLCQVSKYSSRIDVLNGFRVAKSSIAGFGLFTTRPVSMNNRVMEYSGEVVRQLVADRREKLYNMSNLRQQGCYLFRLGPNAIVDATLKGNLARFINHCCNPNCESLTEKGRIVIYSLRDIDAGEELTYDYRFNKEHPDDTVPCYCKSSRCRGFMN